MGTYPPSPEGIAGRCCLTQNVDFPAENQRKIRDQRVGARGLGVYDACMAKNNLGVCLRLSLLSCVTLLSAGTLKGWQERPGAALVLQSNNLKPRGGGAGPTSRALALDGMFYETAAGRV